MKKNCNPYTVPEGFFEQQKDRALTSYGKRARTVKYVILSAALAAALVVIPIFARQGAGNEQRQEFPVNSLAQMYEYDIFLQVNF